MVKMLVRQHNTSHLLSGKRADVIVEGSRLGQRRAGVNQQRAVLTANNTHGDVHERQSRAIQAVRKPVPLEVHTAKVMGMQRPMRKLVVTQNMTLDGSIEMLDDWFDPQLQDEELLAESHRQDSEADALLLGRQTFADFRAYWPAQTDDPGGIADYLNRVAKYVVSSTIDDPGWANSVVLRGDPIPHVEALKNQPGMDVVVTGSISLTHTLIAAGRR